MRIAILLATFNRKEKTIACLKKVMEQEKPANVFTEVFLTDDASSDGTANDVIALFPEINIYHGTGSFFWAGGMRHSWRKALKGDFDYYLLLNDDTFLFKDSIAKLLESNANFYQENLVHAISIGSTRDPDTQAISYGGRKLYSKYRPHSYLVSSGSSNIDCDLGEANIMLVPNSIVKKIGILSEKYTHSAADNDYTLLARRAGFKVIIAPGYFGDCKNDHHNHWATSKSKLSERVKDLYSIKVLNYKEYLYYIRTNFPYYLPFAFITIWLKTLLPNLYEFIYRKRHSL